MKKRLIITIKNAMLGYNEEEFYEIIYEHVKRHVWLAIKYTALGTLILVKLLEIIL